MDYAVIPAVEEYRGRFDLGQLGHQLRVAQRRHSPPRFEGLKPIVEMLLACQSRTRPQIDKLVGYERCVVKHDLNQTAKVRRTGITVRLDDDANTFRHPPRSEYVGNAEQARTHGNAMGQPIVVLGREL